MASRYPDWVNQFKTKGTSVKMVRGNYYLYRTTSRRVPGMKNPQPVSEYIGVITPEGVIRAERSMVQLSDVKVWEYGFSKAVMAKLPQGADVEAVARAVMKESPFSFLVLEHEPGDVPDSISIIEEVTGKPLSSLEILKGIFLVESGRKKMVSTISGEQQKILDALEVDICDTPT